MSPTTRASKTVRRRMTITGGAGFIGVNSADHFAREGWKVTVFDNLSRPGSRENLDWLAEAHPQAVTSVVGDVRDPDAVAEAVRGANAVLHLAAQVAVTTSMVEPVDDFDVNARGTLNVLEAVRHQAPEAMLVYASTNKVYGSLKGWPFERIGTRWLPGDVRSGVPETQCLDFHSPYGCSKGAADQYVRDYARCYGLKTVVLRQSCIYGKHQNGTEDQGWVAHFVHSILRGQPITIYGDGCQVRDLLDVRDLCRLYSLCVERADHVSGAILNIGGGQENMRSVIEVLRLIERVLDTRATISFADWRAGDQVYYASDVALARDQIGWRPEIRFETGLLDLVAWARTAQGTAMADAAHAVRTTRRAS